MTPEKQIRALAELDGAQSDWYCVECGNKHTYPSSDNYRKYCNGLCNKITSHNPLFKAYLTSYDAIIPLIQKQSPATRVVIAETLFAITKGEVVDWGYYEGEASICWDSIADVIIATPAQLCEALLRATGKWEDE